MKTSFQQMLSKILREQTGSDILQGIDIDAEPEGFERPVISQEDVPENNEDGGDAFQIPDGAVHNDLNGNGEWDYPETFTLDGVDYLPQLIAIPTGNGWQQAYTLVQTLNGQMVGYVNGAWQVIGTNTNGTHYLVPNMWYIPGQGAGGYYATAVNIPGFGWQYFLTTDNIWGGNVEWWNPNTGAIPGTYPVWNIGMNVQIGDWSINNIPLVPFGEAGLEDLFPGWNPDSGLQGAWRIFISGSVSFGADDLYQGDAIMLRMLWTAFWNWYYQEHGEYPPESHWPDHAPWWKNWWEAHGHQYEEHADDEDNP